MHHQAVIALARRTVAVLSAMLRDGESLELPRAARQLHKDSSSAHKLIPSEILCLYLDLQGAQARSKTMSCAPSQRHISPKARRFSLPSVTVKKWLPASCPSLLAKIVPA
jgi:hypothetical protein